MIRTSKHLELREAHSRAYGELLSGLVAVEFISLVVHVTFTEYLPCPGIVRGCLTVTMRD